MTMKNSKKFMLIITAVFFGILLALTLAVLTFVPPGAADMVALMLTGLAFITVVILSFIIASHYKNLSKMHGGDKNFDYYFKKIWIIIILIVGLSIAVGFAGGMILNGFFGGLRMRMPNSFMRGAILKVPLLLIYLAAVYNMLSQFGTKDANVKAFNSHLKILSVALALLLMMPFAVFDSMYYTNVIDSFFANVHAAFSVNVDAHAMDRVTDELTRNPDFNIFLTAFTIILAFAAEMAAAIFAYNNGKKAFLKKRLNPTEYETDEKC